MELDSSSDEEVFYERLRYNRRQRRFKERINFFLTEDENTQRFRLSERQLILLTDNLRPIISHRTQNNCALSAEQQVRLSLRFLASGSDYRVVGDAHGVSKSTVFSTVHRFVDAVNEQLYFDCVKFPDDSQAVADRFRGRGKIP